MAFSGLCAVYSCCLTLWSKRGSSPTRGLRMTLIRQKKKQNIIKNKKIKNPKKIIDNDNNQLYLTK